MHKRILPILLGAAVVVLVGVAVAATVDAGPVTLTATPTPTAQFTSIDSSADGFTVHWAKVPGTGQRVHYQITWQRIDPTGLVTDVQTEGVNQQADPHKTFPLDYAAVGSTVLIQVAVYDGNLNLLGPANLPAVVKWQ